MAERSALMRRLREETAAHHKRLEDGLALSPQSVNEVRIRGILRGFYAFYRAWEPWIEVSPINKEFFAPRRKSPVVARDLRALGLKDFGQIPRFDLRLGEPTLARAFGSLYVIEGSTLGGQIIERWIRSSAWMPEGGLEYFSSYGPYVGWMWKEFQRELSAKVPVSSQDQVIDGAASTFDNLHFWFCGLREVA